MYAKIGIAGFVLFVAPLIFSNETPCTIKNLGGDFPENVCILKLFFEQVTQGTPEDLPHAYLFYGEPGTGKKAVVLGAAKEYGMHVEHFRVNDYINTFDHKTPLTEAQSSYLADELWRFYEVIKEKSSKSKQPIAVLIDNVDLLGDYVCGSIRLQIDATRDKKQVSTIMTAHKLYGVEEGARTRCIRAEFKKPDKAQRRAILAHLNGMVDEKSKLTERQLQILSIFTSGFVGKDLSILIERATSDSLWNSYWQTLYENQQLSKNYMRNTILSVGIFFVTYLVSKMVKTNKIKE